jgi:uncharacterized membrane protein
LFIATATLCWGLWVLTSKMAVRNMSPMLVQLVMLYVYSSVAPIATLVMKWRGEDFGWTKPGIAWASVTACLGLTAVYSYMFAIEHKPASLVNPITSANPVLGFMLCCLFLGETFTFQKAIGIAMVVAGCIVISQ